MRTTIFIIMFSWGVVSCGNLTLKQEIEENGLAKVYTLLSELDKCSLEHPYRMDNIPNSVTKRIKDVCMKAQLRTVEELYLVITLVNEVMLWGDGYQGAPSRVGAYSIAGDHFLTRLSSIKNKKALECIKRLQGRYGRDGGYSLIYKSIIESYEDPH